MFCTDTDTVPVTGPPAGKLPGKPGKPPGKPGKPPGKPGKPPAGPVNPTGARPLPSLTTTTGKPATYMSKTFDLMRRSIGLFSDNIRPNGHLCMRLSS